MQGLFTEPQWDSLTYHLTIVQKSYSPRKIDNLRSLDRHSLKPGVWSGFTKNWQPRPTAEYGSDSQFTGKKVLR